MTGAALHMARDLQPSPSSDASSDSAAPSLPPWPTIPPDMRLIAWAGFQLIVPENLEVARMSGNERKGHLALADEAAVRMELAWDTARGGWFKPDRATRRHITDSHKRNNRGPVPEPDAIKHDHITPLLHLPDEGNKLDRFVGFSDRTRRIFELVYFHGPAGENRRVIDVTIPQLADQPRDKPQWWSYFDCRFVAPAGFRFGRATLNLGDMFLRLIDRKRESRSNQVHVREIYPATLAFKRQSLAKWAHQWATEERKLWRVKRQGLGKLAALRTTDIDTPLGSGIEVEVFLRWSLRPFLWRFPRRGKLWLIHNTQRDRLHGLLVAHRKRDRIEPMLNDLVAGLIRESQED